MINLTDYDNNNVFAKILRGELPCNKVYEDNYVLSFHDVNPTAAVHVLIIPRGAYTCMTDFLTRASNNEQLGFFGAIDKVVDTLDLKEKGFSVTFHQGEGGGQEVPHLHLHIRHGHK